MTSPLRHQGWYQIQKYMFTLCVGYLSSTNSWFTLTFDQVVRLSVSYNIQNSDWVKKSNQTNAVDKNGKHSSSSNYNSNSSGGGGSSSNNKQ